jgi:hypothetical protein
MTETTRDQPSASLVRTVRRLHAAFGPKDIVLVGGGLPLLPHPSQQATLRLVTHRVYRTTGTVPLEDAQA